jgi:hypothetical protein
MLFSNACPLSTASPSVSADASGANVSAVATAKPPTTAILRMSIVKPFNDFHRKSRIYFVEPSRIDNPLTRQLGCVLNCLNPPRRLADLEAD